MNKPRIKLLSTGAILTSETRKIWLEHNMFSSTILICWIDFLNEQLINK